MKRLLRSPIVWLVGVLIVIFISILGFIITTPIPLTEEVLQEELVYYITPTDIDMEACDFSLTFGKLLSRDTSRKKDIVAFTIEHNDRIGDRINYNDSMKTTIQTVYEYKGILRYKNKNWVIETVDIKDFYPTTVPLAGIDGEQFAEDMKYNYVKQETDLQQGMDKVTFKEIIDNSLFKTSRTIVYYFKFQENEKRWETSDVEWLNDWDTEYNILGQWQLAESITDMEDVYLDIKSLSEDGLLTVAYIDIDNTSDRELLYWEGKVNEEAPYMFSSEKEFKTLFIPYFETPDVIDFGGHLYKR